MPSPTPPGAAFCKRSRSVARPRLAKTRAYALRILSARPPFPAYDLPSYVHSETSGIGRGQETRPVDVVPPQRDCAARICPRTARAPLAATTRVARAPCPRARPTRSKLLSWKRSLLRDATLVAILNERYGLFATVDLDSRLSTSVKALKFHRAQQDTGLNENDEAEPTSVG